MVFEQVLKADMYYSGVLGRVHSEAGSLYRRPVHNKVFSWKCCAGVKVTFYSAADEQKAKKKETENKKKRSIPYSIFLI